jgi:hypothetical protein
MSALWNMTNPFPEKPIPESVRIQFQQRLLKGESLVAISKVVGETVMQLKAWQNTPAFAKGMIEQAGLVNAAVAGEAAGVIVRVLLENAKRVEEQQAVPGAEMLTIRAMRELATTAKVCQEIQQNLAEKVPVEPPEDAELERAIERLAGKKVMRQKEGEWVQPEEKGKIEGKIARWENLAADPRPIDKEGEAIPKGPFDP